MTQEQKYNEAVEILKNHLRQKHLRCTQERLVIVEQICSYKNHFTAEQLSEDLQHKLHLSTATIYNTLLLLEDCGLIRKLESQAGTRFAQYELLHERGKSMRFICTRCGREVGFKNKIIDKILFDKHFTNFNMQTYSLNVYGTCKICRRKF